MNNRKNGCIRYPRPYPPEVLFPSPYPRPYPRPYPPEDPFPRPYPPDWWIDL